MVNKRIATNFMKPPPSKKCEQCFHSGSVCSVVYLKYDPSFLFRLSLHAIIISCTFARVMVNIFCRHPCVPFHSYASPDISPKLSICSSHSLISTLIQCINGCLNLPLPLFTPPCIPMLQGEVAIRTLSQLMYSSQSACVRTCACVCEAACCV